MRVIIENGVIRTLDPSHPTAVVLAVAGEMISALDAAPQGLHEHVDLAGRCVIPGLADAHVHFPTWSMAQREVRLEGTGSLDEALERVAVAARDAPAGRWLRGTGWRQDDWRPLAEPTRQALDRRGGRRAGGAVGEGLPLAVAELGGARACRRRPADGRAESWRWTRTAS